MLRCKFCPSGDTGLHLPDVVGVALPFELGRDALGQNFIVIAGLGVDSTLLLQLELRLEKQLDIAF